MYISWWGGNHETGLSWCWVSFLDSFLPSIYFDIHILCVFMIFISDLHVFWSDLNTTNLVLLQRNFRFHRCIWRSNKGKHYFHWITWKPLIYRNSNSNHSIYTFKSFKTLMILVDLIWPSVWITVKRRDDERNRKHCET